MHYVGEKGGGYVVHDLHDAVLAQIHGEFAIVAATDNAHESILLLNA